MTKSELKTELNKIVTSIDDYCDLILDDEPITAIDEMVISNHIIMLEYVKSMVLKERSK